jgi:hypothetical protein
VASKRKKMIQGKLYPPGSQAYWESLLIKEGLGMGVGTTSKLSYGGSTTELETLSELQGGGVRRILKKKVDY